MPMFNLFQRPAHKLGVAFSGGGARGFAHAGAILAFNRLGVRPDIVAGVSAGSVVAVMHAAGIPPLEMLGMFDELRFSDLAEWTLPKTGLFKIDKFKEFIRRNIPYENIEDLPLPTVIGVTDFDRGVPVAFRRGNIADVVTASCSIPMVFTPAVIDGIRYVDGGVLHNLPAWAIRKECRTLIGVNCSPLANNRTGDNLFDIAMRSYDLVARTNAVQDMELCDLVIKTDEIADYKVFNLNDIHRVFRVGYHLTLASVLDNVERLPHGVVRPSLADPFARPGKMPDAPKKKK